MLYHDLSDEVVRALAILDTDGGEVAWQVVSGAIFESNAGYPDTTLVQGLWLQDTHCVGGSSMFDDTNSRSFVTFGTVRGRESCVEADPLHSMTIFYRDAACRAGRNEYEEFDVHYPATFEPKCVVVLLESDSHLQLRDELVTAGRLLSDPLCVSEPT